MVDEVELADLVVPVDDTVELTDVVELDDVVVETLEELLFDVEVMIEVEFVDEAVEELLLDVEVIIAVEFVDAAVEEPLLDVEATAEVVPLVGRTVEKPEEVLVEEEFEVLLDTETTRTFCAAGALLYMFRRFGPPQYSVAFAAHAMLHWV